LKAVAGDLPDSAFTLEAIVDALHQRLAASMWWCDPRPSIREVSRNGEATTSRGQPSSCPQSSGNIFSFSHPLTCRNWTASPFFLYDRTLICSPPSLLIFLLLLVSSNNHPNSGSAPVHPTNPKYPCSVCSHEVRRTSI